MPNGSLKYWLPRRDGGAGGIRTLDRALQPYNGLANRRLQPLGHSSGKADMPDAGASRKRQMPAAASASHYNSLRTAPELKPECRRHQIAVRTPQMRQGFGDACLNGVPAKRFFELPGGHCFPPVIVKTILEIVRPSSFD